MSDRERERAVVVTEHGAVGIHDIAARMHERRSLAAHEPARVTARRETELLGVGLGRDRQAEPLRQPARLGLRQPTDWEQRAGELRLSEHVEHVALVLGRIGPAQQVPGATVVSARAHVVPGGNELDAQLVRTSQERAELDLPVAARARVRRATGRVLRDEVLDHRFVEGGREVTDLERESADRCDRGSVRPRGRAAAAVLHPVEVDERHVRAHDVEAPLCKEAGCDGGIDPAGHRDQYRWHAVQATARPGASRLVS